MKTETKILFDALKQISSLWPEQTSAKILDVSGINDGRSRAIIADAAITLARNAIRNYETAVSVHPKMAAHLLACGYCKEVTQPVQGATVHVPLGKLCAEGQTIMWAIVDEVQHPE